MVISTCTTAGLPTTGLPTARLHTAYSAYTGIILQTDEIYYHVYNKPNLANKYLITLNNCRNMFYSTTCN